MAVFNSALEFQPFMESMPAKRTSDGKSAKQYQLCTPGGKKEHSSQFAKERPTLSR